MNDMYAKDISKKIKSVKRDKQRKGAVYRRQAGVWLQDAPNGEKQDRH